MTSGNDHAARTGWLQSWAAEQLQLAADAPADSVRARLCAHLEEEDFLPAPAMRDAAHAMASAAGNAPREQPWSPWMVREYHDHLRAEVEKFAAEFFSLPCADRKERWQLLLNQCDGAPQLIGRLRFLALGLNVPAEVSEALNARAKELARRIQAMFVLRPAERAAARQAFLSEVTAEVASWEVAARELTSANRTIAELEPILMDSLTQWTALQKRRARAKLLAPLRNYYASHRAYWIDRARYWGSITTIVAVLSAVIVTILVLFDKPQSAERKRLKDKQTTHQAIQSEAIPQELIAERDGKGELRLYGIYADGTRRDVSNSRLMWALLGVTPPAKSQQDTVDFASGKENEGEATQAPVSSETSDDR